jgi:hypothetical protein
MRPNFLYRNIQLLQNKLKPPSLNYHLPFHFPPLVDFNQLSVLDIGHIFYIIDANQIKHNPYDKFYPKKVVTATCEEHPFLIVTFDFCARPMMFRCGDNRWTRIPYLSQSLGKSGDICLFKGRPYVVDKTGLTAMIRPDLSIHLVADPMFCGGDKFLVECDCGLLLVDINVSDDGSNDLRIHVYRLDDKERKWIKLANLGDMVLLLGNQISFSASASDLGFPNGNCIILNAGDLSDCFEMDIFQLDQGRVSPLCDNPDYLKLFLPSPEWMVELQP